MKLRAAPFVAAGIVVLLLASVAGVVVVSQDDDDSDEVSTEATTPSTFPPFEEPTTSSSLFGPELPVVTEVPASPASLVPVDPPSSTSTTSSVAPAPMLAVEPASCQAPPGQPPAGSPVGPSGVFAVAIGDGAVKLANPIGRLPAWRPRTGQVVSVTVDAGKPPGLCLSGPDGAGAKRLTTPVGVGRPAVSFDGARLAVRSGRPGVVDLVVGSVEGADQTLIFQAPDMGDPVWLGNGTAVVTCALGGRSRRLVAVPAGGGAPRVLRDSCPAGPVASAPDGNRIAFAQGDQVVVLNVTTRATTSLRIGPVSTAAAPTWSPDGKRVAFAYTDASGPALGMLDLDAGSGSTRLRSAGLTAPSWAPAGDLIAFVGTEGGGLGLFVVKPDGTGLRRVAACQARCALAAQPWASDGSSVVLEATGTTA